MGAVGDQLNAQHLLDDFKDLQNGRNQPIDLRETGGFNIFTHKQKNATQQVSAKATRKILLQPDSTARQNQYVGDNLNILDMASEADDANNAKNLLKAHQLQDVKGVSSYGDLLNDVVEDEFELTIDEGQAMAKNLQRILFKPAELASKYNIVSMLCASVQPVNQDG